jgi:hypothetical protein
MPAPDVLELLRQHDPARELLPAPAAARERLRRFIVATHVPGPVRPARRRYRRIVLVAAVGALGLAAAGWGFYSAVLDTPETVRSDFADVTGTIPLPPGASWEQPNLDEDALYGRQAGLMLALYQATCAWLGYWSDGTPSQRAEAISGFRQIRTLMPLHRKGAPEEAGGFDAGSLRHYDALIADMRRGDPTRVEQYLLANCS